MERLLHTIGFGEELHRDVPFEPHTQSAPVLTMYAYGLITNPSYSYILLEKHTDTGVYHANQVAPLPDLRAMTEMGCVTRQGYPNLPEYIRRYFSALFSDCCSETSVSVHKSATIVSEYTHRTTDMHIHYNILINSTVLMQAADSQHILLSLDGLDGRRCTNPMNAPRLADNVSNIEDMTREALRKYVVSQPGK